MIVYHDLSCLPLEVTRHASEFCVLGVVAPCSDFLVRSGPFSHFSFLVLSVCQFIGEGDGREAGRKCYLS